MTLNLWDTHGSSQFASPVHHTRFRNYDGKLRKRSLETSTWTPYGFPAVFVHQEQWCHWDEDLEDDPAFTKLWEDKPEEDEKPIDFHLVLKCKELLYTMPCSKSTTSDTDHVWSFGRFFCLESKQTCRHPRITPWFSATRMMVVVFEVLF